ncbi:hypothetical protein DAPPUDRAFT_337216 [Daphnia pulex]|uniref:RNA exonuclease 1 homolog-like domain-containing protein n=1 Tax=Daphnia pulex TaxID=6669 RepID=E9I189_DAPPU|nr:hypothetical protein DAPPUDRAFT_337216 [Daphnia pulex]|eukprot:EFX62241.1 hypothetical protein DAPPUDRAFT_337216 [Daphnia pulex]
MKAEEDAHNQIAWEMSAEQPTLDMCMSIFLGAIYLGHINDAIRWIWIDIQDAILYRQMKKHVLTLEQQDVSDFPRPDPNSSGRAVVNSTTLFRIMVEKANSEGLAGKQFS